MESHRGPQRGLSVYVVDYMPTVTVTPLCVYLGAVVMTSTLPTHRPPGRVGYVLYSDSGSLGSTTPVNPDDLLLLPIPQLLHQPPCRLLSLCHYIVLPFFLYILIIPRFRTNVHLFFHFLWTFFCYEKKICGLLRTLRYATMCTFSLVWEICMYTVHVVCIAYIVLWRDL